jgi:hypothetical protein
MCLQPSLKMEGLSLGTNSKRIGKDRRIAQSVIRNKLHHSSMSCQKNHDLDVPSLGSDGFQCNFSVRMICKKNVPFVIVIHILTYF